MNEREKTEYKKLLRDLEKFAELEERAKKGLKAHLSMKHGKPMPVYTAYNQRLEIAGLHIKHTKYFDTQFKGFLRSRESVKQALESRKKTLELRKQLDEELREYAEKFPDATINDAEAIVEKEKILSKYQDSLKTRKDNLKRRINELKNLINSNWDLWTHFVTLTFKTNLTDVDHSQKIFSKWRKKIEGYFPDFLYVCVKEYQGRGAVHFHLLCRFHKNKPRLSGKTKNGEKEFDFVIRCWTESFTKDVITGDCNIKGVMTKYVQASQHVPKDELELVDKKEGMKIKQIWNLGNYLTSYLKKGASDPRMAHRKLFTSSSRDKLRKKIVITDDKKIDQALTGIKVGQLKETTYEIKEKKVVNNEIIESDTVIGEMTFYNVLIQKTDEDN